MGERGADSEQARAAAEAARNELAAARTRIAELEQAVAAREQECLALRAELAEALKLCTLQKADLDRYRAALERMEPNRPERVATSELQLAFAEVVATFGAAVPSESAANDNDSTASSSLRAPGSSASSQGAAAPHSAPRRRHRHGRRRIDLTTLPVEVVELAPDSVAAAGDGAFQRVSDEISHRVAYRRGGYVRVQVVRIKFVPIAKAVEAVKDGLGMIRSGADDPSSGPYAAPASSSLAEVPADMPTPPRLMTPTPAEPSDRAAAAPAPAPASGVYIAPLPENMWPHCMADPSAIAHIAISKYGDYLPLHRQEGISEREGFVIPRSTMCGWLREGHKVLYRIVDAMLDEAKASAFCIATDATGARVRARGQCESWHLFVLIADHDHVVFRHAREHTGAVIQKLLKGFHGHLLSDASAIYDILHREEAITEVACWAHLRRLAYKALGTDRPTALQGLAIIGKLFEAEAHCRPLAAAERTAARAARARPILALFDRWISETERVADPKSPLARVVTYYTNQRAALHRFLEDGRLRIDNNISEGQLRSVVLGRVNWNFFANENGLLWYTTYRSLIASAILHRLNPERYLEQVMRLAPHWPVTRVLELAPRYWRRTVAGFDRRHRAIILSPWEKDAGEDLVAEIDTLPDARVDSIASAR